MKQIMISVPDEWLEGTPPNLYDVMGAVMNGTVLPEHHGRLIDADAYIDKHAECGWLDDITVDEFNKITPTIIPAAKEKRECTDCKWYGFTCECPVHCTQDTKIAWESATKEGKSK